MKNWTVRRQIIVGFSAVIMIMVALALFAMFRLTIIRARTNTILTDTLPGLYGIAKIDSLSKEQYTLLQKHVLITDKDEERQIETQMTAVSRNLDELYREYEKSIFTEEDRRLFDATKDARKVYSDAVAKVLDFSRHAEPKEAEAEMERQVDPPFQAFVQGVQAEVAFNQRQGEESGRNIHDAVNSAETGIILALGIGLVLACLSCYFLTQAINKPLARVVDAMQVVSRGDFSQRLILDGRGEFGVLAERLNLMTSDLTILVGSVKESGIRVNTSATEIAATSQQQLATSNEIAATTSEVGATSKEISATSKELTQTVKDLTEVAEKAASLAGSGHAGLLRMRTTMQQIMEASASINAKLAVLSEKAGNIGTVVTTITKVADQTNLLSLNAAIEAEKAGEHGRGFSVVSTEIRRLADQTALATTDIEQMVKEIQSAVSAGVMGMDKFSEEVRRGVDVMHQVSEELTQIIQQVQSLTASFETVNEGMQSQSIGAQQISEALGQLSEASRQTVESLQQSNQAIEQLNIAARTMQNGVARFTLPV